MSGSVTVEGPRDEADADRSAAPSPPAAPERIREPGPEPGPEPVAEYDAAGRPTRPIPIPQLIRLSLYWLGLSSIWTGINIILTGRLSYSELVPVNTEGAAFAQMTVFGAVVAMVVQPTVATISDYTSSRWGRRKPYIVVGSVLDLVFLYALGTANSVLAIAVFMVLLQLSSNTSQGPFQGYIPDLVPERQVGLASSLMGLFQTLGNITGYIVGVVAVALDAYALGLIALGVIEVVTMVSVVLRVDEGRRAKDRGGRSWWAIAGEAWGTDILRERSYVWLVVSRLAFLMPAATIVNFVSNFYLKQVFGMTADDVVPRFVVSAVLAVAMVTTVVPAGRSSDRFGRKPIIWVACASGALGMAVVAVAPAFPIAALGVVFVGVASGAFLAVDWALMTDIIPKASSGRYMGISNLATGSAGTLMVILGGVTMDAVNAALGPGMGVRAVFLLGCALFAVAALLLRPVDPRPRIEAAPLVAGS